MENYTYEDCDIAIDNNIFLFLSDNNVTVFRDKNGKYYFLAKEIAQVLGYKWNGTACIAKVPEEWRGFLAVWTPFGIKNMDLLSEEGLYFFLLRSNKKIAITLQKCLAGEVMSILEKGEKFDPIKDSNYFFSYFFKDLGETQLIKPCHFFIDKPKD